MMKKRFLFLICLIVSCFNLSADDYVDLGLPSGTRWATCNLGASAPNQVGNYYAWGETTPHEPGQYEFYWYNYSLCRGTGKLFYKYSTHKLSLANDSIVALDAEDDAAIAALGSNWRMPTIHEAMELCDTNYTISTWYPAGNVEFGGVAGMKVQSRMSGYTDRYVFLPACGVCNQLVLENANTKVCLWTSTLYVYSGDVSNSAYSIIAESSSLTYKGISRCKGQNIRPVYAVQDSSEIVERPYVDMGLPSGTLWATYNIGASVPEEFGDYLAWGEIYGSQRGKCDFDELHYLYRDKSNHLYPIKYALPQVGITLYTDNKRTLEPKDDAATVRWGKDWQMPSPEQYEELLDSTHCIVRYDSLNGAYGVRVTSRYNGASVFFPAGGDYAHDYAIPGDYNSPMVPTIRDVGKFGYFWTNRVNEMDSRYPFDATVMEISTRTIMDDWDWSTVDYVGLGLNFRWHGKNVRPVRYQDPGPEQPEEPEEPEIHEYVDLGLPSGLKWATCNIDAQSPTDYGGYYAFGEIVGSTEGQKNFTWGWYNYTNQGTATSLTKYNLDERYGEEVDGLSKLTPLDDVAAYKWGRGWRIPSEAECSELLNENYTTWTWYDSLNTEFHGVAGYKVQSKIEGYTDKFIFLPAGGYYSEVEYSGDILKYRQEYGCFWTSEIHWQINYRSNYLSIRPETYHSVDWCNRNRGMNVRAVYDPKEPIKRKLIFATLGGTEIDTLCLEYGDKIVIPANPTKEGFIFKGWSPKVPRYMPDKDLVLTALWSDIAPWDGTQEVDLGLPSGTVWRACNVGASTRTDAGLYFAWGETTTKSSYTLGNYKYYNTSTSRYTKYCTDDTYGSPDGKTQLLAADDAATTYLGSTWCMPTKDDLAELADTAYTTWTWYETGNYHFDGVPGYLIRGRKEGYTDKFIFLPAVGNYSNDQLVGQEVAHYNSSTLYDCSQSYRLYASAKNRIFVGSGDKERGTTIRPVLKQKIARSFTVRFVDYEGTELQREVLAYGKTPSYKGATPTKPSNEYFSYTFKSWSPAISTVKADVTYRPLFDSARVYYTLRYFNADGSVGYTYTRKYGDSPLNPKVAKASTAKYTYIFKGWNPEPVPVTCSVDYYPVFDSIINTYLIIFTNNGEELYRDSVPYGVMPVYVGEKPTQAPTAANTYEFKGWSPSLYTVTKNQTYRAIFTSTARKYPVTFLHADSTVLQSSEVNYGNTPSYSGTTPSKPSTAQYFYTFKGWDKTLVKVTDTAVYVAQFDSVLRSYIIRWKDYNSQQLYSAVLPYGQMPEYGGTTPSRANTAKYTYTFTGWSPEIVPVTDTATYVAQYDAQINQYTIRFVNDSVELQSELLDYGTKPEYKGTTPTKPATESTEYTFYRWSPTVTMVTKNQTYTATFKSTTRKYSVTFLHADGTELQTSDWDYGTTPTYSGLTPSKPKTAQYTYRFVGWSPTLSAVQSDITYTPVFDSVVNTYWIYFTDNGEILYRERVPYGQMPEYGGTTPSRDNTDQYTYTFKGWSPAIVPVTDTATYVAQYVVQINQYTIRFVNDTTELQSELLDYGTQPQYKGATPTKTSTASKEYTFARWSPTVAIVTQDQTYTAIFTSTTRKYSVTFLNADGTVLQSSEVLYGKTPTYSGATPTKPTTAGYSYTFKGWSPAIVAVTDTAVYVAQYDSLAQQQFTIHVKSANTSMGTVSGGGDYYLNQQATLSATANYGYAFNRWSDGNTDNPRTIMVTKNAQYLAMFTTLQFNIIAVSADELKGNVTGEGDYYYLTYATLTANPFDGYVFSEWDDGNMDNPREILVVEDAIYIATFVLDDKNPTSLDENIVREGFMKIIDENNHVVIICNGSCYNIIGQKL